MLQRGLRMLYSRSVSGSAHSVAGLSARGLLAINLHETTLGKITAAMEQNHFALAALIALKNSPLSLNLQTQQQIVRGLAQYHPRLTPINLKALIWFHNKVRFDMESIDKVILVNTLISYGDHQLIRSALDFLDRVSGGPVPNSAVMALVRFAKERNAVQTCIRLWEYTRHNYPLTFVEYTPIMVDLMEVFSRSRTYNSFALDVARASLTNIKNPGIALSIAKVCYRLGNEQLAREFLATPGLEVTPRIEAAIIQLNTKTGGHINAKKAPSKPVLTPQEFSGIVKAIAERDLESAEHLVGSLTENDTRVEQEHTHTFEFHEKSSQNNFQTHFEASSSKHTPEETSVIDGNSLIEEESTRVLLAEIALCNQYINEGSLIKFKEIYASLREKNANSGILLNLRLKWELSYGSFKHAKRHYQNFNSVPVKQKAIALNTLSLLASDSSDRLWVANERRRLEMPKNKASR